MATRRKPNGPRCANARKSGKPLNRHHRCSQRKCYPNAKQRAAQGKVLAK